MATHTKNAQKLYGKNSMELIKCAKCGAELCLAKDSGGDDMKTIKIICVCKHKNTRTFLGFPKLGGTDEYYFDFTNEDEITCKKRH